MAAGLAQRMLEGHGEAESAGIAPYGERAAAETIRVMRQEGIDLSDHKPRDVTALSLEDYDYVVAMEPYVHRHLQERCRVAPSKLISWDIDDPYGQGIEAYKESLQSIRSHLEDFFAHLGFPSSRFPEPD